MGTIRLSGMISGLDTDAIVKELMNAQKLKNKKVSDKLTLSEWKEEKWKELNSKLYKLYADDLSKLRLQGNYMTKKATSSNDSLVSVTGNATASQGSHVLSITQLASSQYVTGGKIDKDIKASSTLKDIGVAVNTTINIGTKNGKSTSLVVTDKTTLNDFVNACKSVGLNANYDEKQKRIFISSNKSGEANGFTITTNSTSYNDIKTLAGFGDLDAAKQKEVTDAINTLKGTSTSDFTALYQKAVNGQAGANEAEQSKIDAINVLLNRTSEKTEKSLREACIKDVKQDNVRTDLLQAQGADKNEAEQIELAVKAEIRAQAEEQIAQGKLNLGEKTIDEYVDDTYNMYTDSDRELILSKAIDRKYNNDIATYESIVDTAYNNKINAEKSQALTTLENRLSSFLGNSVGDLSALGLSEIDGSGIPATTTDKMTVVAAADAKVVLDGAVLTSDTNSLEVNGLTLNLKGVTTGSESISINVANDTQAIYDMVKNFITSYNTILKEMNTLYYAGSARGYDPLSDEEKEAMTEDQIKKWENKIKDSILRRDSSLGSVIEGMKSAMMSTVTIGDKRYSLSSFGITTSSDYTEKGLLHIYGNKDDATFADQADKLMAALTNDPDNATSALSQIFGKLYDTMYDKMKAIPNVRSIYTFYNDKLMDSEQTKYKKQISQLEVKLKDMEDKYYKQFTAMEKAMARLQQQSSYLAGMLGTSSK